MKPALKTKSKIMFTLLVILLLVSLLNIFGAPVYYLWLLAVVVSGFPLLFIGATCILLVSLFWIKQYRVISAITGVLALIFFCSPVIRAYLVSKVVKKEFNAAFELGSTHLNGNKNQLVFSFSRLFKMYSIKPGDYNTLTYGGGPIQTLDFYPSRITGKRPCIIVVHGGSWSSGDSKQLPELNSLLAQAGYNVASINYHLAPKFQAPLAVTDVEQAFIYLRKNADTLNIDTNNFVLLGRSAGAQIALLSAYKYPQNGLKGVIDFYGPADMVWGYSVPASKLIMDSRAVMERYLGGTYKAVPDKYFASSPIVFVNRQSVPTLIIHGDNDVLVSPVHSQKLDKKLKDYGIKHYYLNLPWATHGFDYNVNGPGGQLSTYLVERFISAVCK